MDLQKYIHQGLKTEEIFKLHQRFGYNKLQGKSPPTDLDFLLRQFKNPLVIVLIVAGIITLGLHEFTDTIVIGLAVFVNTILGFVQERNAERGLEALNKILTPHCLVIRNGKQQTIDARDLVPGDIVLLYDGDKVPADGIIFESKGLLINEAILTGESAPVGKIELPIKENKNNFIYKIEHLIHNTKKISTDNQSFMGTLVASGSGTMIVTAIGMQTEIGKIAQSLEKEQQTETPLEKRLAQLAKWLTIIVITASAGIFLYGLAIGRDATEMFTLSVALAVAAIPEGLVVSLTAILAIGMQRILKRKALVRKLVAAETLGTVTVICVDKTGTLTEGNLQVVDFDFTDNQLGFRASALANDLRDGTELARWEWLKKICKNKKQNKLTTEISDPQALIEKYPRDDAIPFSSETKFLATRHNREIFIVGAPEILLNWTNETNNKRSIIQNTIESWGSQGRRMIGFVYYQSRSQKEAKILFEKLKKHKFNEIKFQWLGLIAYADPIRNGVAQALKQANQAGINIKVITGDYRSTAEAVMKELGIQLSSDQIMEGFELEKLNDKTLHHKISQIKLFARTRPQQKLRIVKALKARDEVVAMMGDGVNDAPAITSSDIGIVVGNASEVARESADIVLLDSNFKTILAAVAEGRGIFDNLRKIVLYLLSDVFTEMILIIGSMLAGWPLAITTVQILWVNLIGDGLPSLALTVDPRDKNILKRKPVNSKLPIINAEMVALMGTIGISTGLLGLASFSWAYSQFGEVVAQTVAFQVLGIGSLFYVFSCKTLTQNIWQKSIVNNKWLTISSIFGLILIVMPIYTPGLNTLLGVVPLGRMEWAVIIGASFGVIIITESVKWIWQKFNPSTSKSV